MKKLLKRKKKDTFTLRELTFGDKKKYDFIKKKKVSTG
jgi:hypothetical protein